MKNKEYTKKQQKKSAVSKRIKDYLIEVAKISAPGYFMMNGSYYRP